MLAAAAAAKSLQSCPTLCDPIDGSPPGSPVPGILQARTLEWVAISFSNAWKWKVKVKSLSRVWLLATRWTVAHQAPPSMGFSRQEYWSGVPLDHPLWCKHMSYSTIIAFLDLRLQWQKRCGTYFTICNERRPKFYIYCTYFCTHYNSIMFPGVKIRLINPCSAYFREFVMQAEVKLLWKMCNNK